MNSKAIAAIAAVVIIVIVVAAAVVVMNDDDSEDDGPIVVTDSRGVTVTIDSNSKIASTSATVTEIVCGLGGISQLAGVTNDSGVYDVSDYTVGFGEDGYPGNIKAALSNETITDLGKMYNIASESVLKCSPDLVIMGGYFNSDATISALESMGIPVVVCYNDNSLDYIYKNIELIGQCIGNESGAEDMIDQMKSVIDKISSWAKGLSTDRSVATLMYYGSSYGTYGCGDEYLPGTPIQTMLGSHNALSISGMYEVVGKEALLAADPDVIIDLTPSDSDGSILESIKTDDVLKTVGAAVNDRIYGAFGTCSTTATLTTQGFVNGVALMAMFIYEDSLTFTIDHYMGDDYASYLKQFWDMVNA